MPQATAGESLAPARWLLFCAVFGITAIFGAMHWDFSWHRSVGRDVFFTPPHCLVYFGALLSTVAPALAIARATWFEPSTQRSVTVWGLKGPLGAFLCGWGGVTMLTGGLFDSWWHRVYGIDIVVQSVPHLIIMIGTFAIALGALLLAALNAQARAPSRGAALTLVHAGGMLLVLFLGAAMEDTFDYLMHGARFYCIVAALVPVVVLGVGRASGLRFGATGVSAVYTVFQLLLIAILPSFHAEPRLGPVLHPVSHFVPPPFPLLVLPAVAVLDGLSPRFRSRGAGFEALAGGALFLGTFMLLQWPFASFLQSPLAENRLFVANEFAFFQAARHPFFPTESTTSGFLVGMSLAFAFASSSSWLGLAASRRLRELRR